MCKIFLFSIIFTSAAYATNQVCILIHGTWGIKSDWHNSGHPFYETIKKELFQSKIKLIDFNWCGTLCYEKRKIAGINLANLIESYPAETTFIIIAHSHGGNIGILASQYLQKADKISKFYALGTPIDKISYLPNMQVIQNFYNIFSFGDLCQTVLGMHERLLPTGPGIYNINLEINQHKPDHEELHCATIAKWLLQIPGLLKDFNWDNHFFAKFYDNGKPLITIDHNFKAKILQDIKMHAQIYANLTDFTNGRSLNISHNKI